MSVHKKRILLIDGNNLCARMAHVFAGVLNKRGEHVGALYGSIDALRGFLVTHPHDSVVCTFDAGIPRFRKRLIPEYKSTRKKEREKNPVRKVFFEEYREQVARLPKLLLTLGVHCALCKNFEADDVIGALVLKRYKAYKTTILSDDKDLIQLVSKQCRQYRPCKRALTTTRPFACVLRRALEGDSSDDIKGVPGIGEKRAGKIIDLCLTEDLSVFFSSLNKEDKYEAKVLEYEKVVRDIIRATDLSVTASYVNKHLSITKAKFNRDLFIRSCRKHGFNKFLKDIKYYSDVFSRSNSYY